MSKPVTGGCQCGAIRYAFQGPVPPAYACHCGECKKQSASAFSMSIPMHYQTLAVTGNSTSFQTESFSGKIKHNFFCGNCGTRLWHSGNNPPDAITLKVGTLDESSGITPRGHLWVSKKQQGIELDPASDQQMTQPEDLIEWRAQLGTSK
ncbi:GFA family protein [Parasphingorhabdus sp.]|uniref:GFA family protein n=1 Tax=Parasphingorhabdus sp. TaxID=2709688 RepID=UPI0032661C63